MSPYFTRLKRDRKNLGFGNRVIGFRLKSLVLRPAAASHSVPPTEALPHATVADLPCCGFGVLNWVLGFWFWFCLEIWSPSQSGICPHQSHRIGLNTKTPTWLILGLFFFLFFILFYFIFSVWLPGKFAKSFCVLKFHVLIGYLWSGYFSIVLRWDAVECFCEFSDLR